MTDELNRLLGLAKAATPGPWVEDDGNVFSAPISNANYEVRSAARRDGRPQPPRGYDGDVAKCSQGLPNFDADSRFIAAANPLVVQALIECLREHMRWSGSDRGLGDDHVRASIAGLNQALKGGGGG